MSSRVQATPMRALQERSALSRSQRRASTSDIEMTITPNSPVASTAKQAKRTTRKVATLQDTYDRWGLDLSHFETKPMLRNHIKGPHLSRPHPPRPLDDATLVESTSSVVIPLICGYLKVDFLFWSFMDKMSWTSPFLRNISSTTQSYSRLRATIYVVDLLFFGIEPGLTEMNSSIRKRRLRYYRGTTAVLAIRR